jgi:hypothetical protein
VEHPATGPDPAALQLARGADLLIHDAMYSDEEYQRRRGWGHSSISMALGVAESAKVEMTDAARQSLSLLEKSRGLREDTGVARSKVVER